MREFMTAIVGLFIDIRELFLKLYEETVDAFYIPPFVAHWFLELYHRFYNLAQEVSWFFDSLYATLELVLDWDMLKSYIFDWLYLLYDLGTIFYYFVNNVWDILTRWWADISLEVQSWIDDANALFQSWIDFLWSQLSTLQVAWHAFQDKIPSIDAIIAWFGNWWSYVLAQIIAWGALTALQIQSLIDSAFAAYAPFWEGWQDWRDSVIQFFTDPWAWLYDRFDDFIERFW